MVNPQKLLGNQPVVFSGNHLEVNEESKIVALNLIFWELPLRNCNS